MDKRQQIQTFPATSKLERFTLSFEFDKTLQEVKRDVRVRTLESL